MIMAPRVHTTASDSALRRPQQATALRAVLTGPWRAHDVTPAMPSVRELGVGSAESTGHRTACKLEGIKTDGTAKMTAPGARSGRNASNGAGERTCEQACACVCACACACVCATLGQLGKARREGKMETFSPFLLPSSESIRSPTGQFATRLRTISTNTLNSTC